jgi:hypothetical protein
MSNFYDTVATTEYDGLIASANPPAEVFSVEIANTGTARTVKRGTILSNSGNDAYAILAEDVDVPASVDAVGTAYRTGHFVRDLVKSEAGAAVTAAQEDSLRLYGILLSDAVDA